MNNTQTWVNEESIVFMNKETGFNSTISFEGFAVKVEHKMGSKVISRETFSLNDGIDTIHALKMACEQIEELNKRNQ